MLHKVILVIIVLDIQNLKKEFLFWKFAVLTGDEKNVRQLLPFKPTFNLQYANNIKIQNKQFSEIFANT